MVEAGLEGGDRVGGELFGALPIVEGLFHLAEVPGEATLDDVGLGLGAGVRLEQGDRRVDRGLGGLPLALTLLDEGEVSQDDALCGALGLGQESFELGLGLAVVALLVEALGAI